MHIRKQVTQQGGVMRLAIGIQVLKLLHLCRLEDHLPGGRSLVIFSVILRTTS